jgi:diadenosine tetraphosphatase ApaH/serine/threonine PP2A family protein phosphatase
MFKRERLKSESVIVEPGNYRWVAVIGDLHGDIKALTALLKPIDLSADLLVFLGDYADRGEYGVETVRKVAELQREHSENVLALMGNHEDYSDAGEPNFSPATLIEEAQAKTGSWDTYFQKELKPFIDNLHLCALIPNNALLVHGGVSSKIKGIDDLKSPSEELRIDLLWSDPMDGDGEAPNYRRGAGVEWGADVSEVVCRALGVGRIIRSHEPQRAMSGPAIVHGVRVVTVSATSVYGGAPFVYFVDPKTIKKDFFKKINGHIEPVMSQKRIWQVPRR